MTDEIGRAANSSGCPAEAEHSRRTLPKVWAYA